MADDAQREKGGAVPDAKGDSKEKWKGFRATAYFLDIQRVRGLGLTKVEASSAGEEAKKTITVGDALDAVCNQSITKIGSPEGRVFHPTQVSTQSGEYVFDGPLFNQELLKLLLELRQDGINAFAASWFWYDTDSCMREPHEVYDFFVVHDKRIVRERVSFSRFYGNGFDPSIFTPFDDSERLWSGEPGWDGAHLRFWYRKFYQETERGQLMVLRTDEPELHHFPEGRWRPDMALGLIQDQLQDRLTKTHSMLESGLSQVQRQLTETHGLLRWVIFALVAVLVAILVGRR